MPFLRPRNMVGFSRTREIEKSTLKNGLRTNIHNPNGSSYRGFWKDNLMEGSGVVITKGIQAYFGDFHNNARNGFGLLLERLEDCNVYRLLYRGDWKGGYRHGFGVCDFKEGNYYIGEWRWGKRHGYGRMWYADGAFFSGEWVKDKRHGMGLLVRADGSRYEGYWVNDNREGKGRFFHLDSGQMQEGIWKEDVCVYSTMIDIMYRQCCLYPTIHPIPKPYLNDEETEKFEMNASMGKVESCLSLLSLSEETRTTVTYEE